VSAPERVVQVARAAVRGGRGGQAAIQVELGGQAIEATEQAGFGLSTAVGLLAAIVVLLLTFGSLTAMGLPIVTALFGLGTGLGAIALFTHVVDTPNFSSELAAMIGLGVGIDYALFILTRFREAYATPGPTFGDARESVVEAIDTAEKAGLPLRIAGIIQDQAYFDAQVAPRLDGERVQFVGPVRAEDRSAFLGGALALLHLISFDEPFGFSVVEAMACGTPVIACARGSMPELIEPGYTGSLVADVGGAVEAVSRIGQLDRGRIRDRAVARFGHDRMIDAYVDAYECVLRRPARAALP